RKHGLRILTRFKKSRESTSRFKVYNLSEVNCQFLRISSLRAARGVISHRRDQNIVHCAS
ncbi:unnamed protein product, partial [Callosobruchus maculatus]